MNLRRLAKFFTWDIPNSKTILISDFVDILENNLKIDDKSLNEWRHKSGAVVSDYLSLLKHLEEKENGKWIIWYLLEYFELPKDFVCPISFSEHIIDCSGTVWTSLKVISERLDQIDETEFSSLIVMPILHAMWYEQVSFKWKVNETDYWNDFYPMKFTSPWGVVHYTWVQVKATNMTQWDTSKTWKQTINLIDELRTWFTQTHELIDWTIARFSEMIVMNSKSINATTRKKIQSHEDLKSRKIIIYDKEWVLSLIEKFNIDFDAQW